MHGPAVWLLLALFLPAGQDTRRPDGSLEARVSGAGGERPQAFIFTRHVAKP